jgi:polar amino acid transport system substrate-binding protein
MRRWIVGLTALAVVAVACAPEEEAPQASGSTGATGAEEQTAEECATAHEGDLFAAGTLTVGTDQPVFQPWFAGTGTYEDWEADPDFGIGNPASGEGYESEVTYAVAELLGFSADQVVWVPLSFNESYKPGPKDFDFYVGQVEYLPERAEAVTFSDGYYDVSQALVARKGSPLADATTLAELKPYKLGAQVGTTSFTAIEDQIQPDQEISVFNQSVDVLQAFNNRQIDGYVVDAPAAYVNVLIQDVKNGVVVGQLPSTGGYFGLVLDQGNALVDCLNIAIGELQADGTLAALEEQYLGDVTFPVFE